MQLPQLKARMRRLASPSRARQNASYFKTGPGGYGAGDVFLGLQVPQLRRLARENGSLRPRDIEALLRSEVHEERLFALLVLVREFEKGTEAERERCFKLYVKNLGRVNNWDLVDASAEHIVGGYLERRSKAQLYRWAKDKSLWHRRIALLATRRYLKQGDFTHTLRLAKLLLKDKEDLLHKAVGWLLREIGDIDPELQRAFLKRHLKRLPRTALRYAIEHFPSALRAAYLKGEV